MDLQITNYKLFTNLKFSKMKKLISKFSDKLLSNQQLKTVKGGTQYCNCGDGAGPQPVPSGQTCSQVCNGGGYPSDYPGGSWYGAPYVSNGHGNGWG